MPAARDQSRWLIPTFAVLTIVGLLLLVLAIAVKAWWVVAVGAFGVVGNGLSWWNQLVIRRQGDPRRGVD